MQRYHFNLSDGFETNDESGYIFAQAEQAHVAAVRYTGELLKDNPDLLAIDHHFHLTVTDDCQGMVYRISVSAHIAKSDA